eukprot:4505556-Prymnesium_polylepis.2
MPRVERERLVVALHPHRVRRHREWRAGAALNAVALQADHPLDEQPPLRVRGRAQHDDVASLEAIVHAVEDDAIVAAAAVECRAHAPAVDDGCERPERIIVQRQRGGRRGSVRGDARLYEQCRSGHLAAGW